jgi:hypothetical protein
MDVTGCQFGQRALPEVGYEVFHDIHGSPSVIDIVLLIRTLCSHIVLYTRIYIRKSVQEKVMGSESWPHWVRILSPDCGSSGNTG